MEILPFATHWRKQLLNGMDPYARFGYFSDMVQTSLIPAYQLYGEQHVFPDVLHIERIVDRAAGLDWRIAPHRHLHLHQLFLLRSGDIRLTVDGENLSPSPPVLLNLPRGTVHGFTFSAGTDGYVLTLPTREFGEVFEDGGDLASRAARFFAILPDEEAAALFSKLSAVHAATGPMRATRLRSLALLALCHAFEHGMDRDAVREATRGDPRMARFEALVAQHHRQRWPVSRYASEMALSPRHLSRLCLTESGLSAQAFIDAHRMREACRLLVYTRMSIASVAFSLGYEDASYFSRAFQRAVGLAPTAYRSRFDE